MTGIVRIIAEYCTARKDGITGDVILDNSNWPDGLNKMLLGDDLTGVHSQVDEQVHGLAFQMGTLVRRLDAISVGMN